MNEQRDILTASEAGLVLRTLDDIGDVISAGLGADGLILTESEVGPDFFDLRTGLAGEAMQKFVNYHVRVAIVVSTPASHGQRFVELAREHATHPVVRFVDTLDAARAWLCA